MAILERENITIDEGPEWQNRLIDNLQTGILEITFTKVDGTIREMRCTLDEYLVPTSSKLVEDIEESSRAENPNVQAVWDMDIGAWRSFRWDSLISIEVIE